MNNADNNPPRQEQEAQARHSPMKTPETETAHADEFQVSQGAGAQQQSGSPHRGASDRKEPVEGRSEQDQDGPSRKDAAYTHERHAVFPEDVETRGADVANDMGSDSTVDTDGKTQDTLRQARADAVDADARMTSDRPEARRAALDRANTQQMFSNATLSNAVMTPPSGLAGIDSRPRGNAPDVLVSADSQVIDEGFVAQPGLYEFAGRDSDDDEIAHATKRREHMAANHQRMGHHIRIQRSAES